MTQHVTGVLKLAPKKGGGGFLRDLARSFQRSPKGDIYVPERLIRRHGIVEGAAVEGSTITKNNKLELAEVDSICGLSPEAFRDRAPFAELTAINPTERFRLGDSDDMSMRILDLLAPVAKGTRGLIVSPPKAGKTMLLESLAKAIRAAEPDTRIIVLLIDERPEEVTSFRRSTDAEVLASTSDRDSREHIDLTELTLAHVRAELECGRDIVVLVDSITRMGRAFNHKNSGRGGRGGGASGRTLSGGMGAGALEIPRRFFGLARNVENGGSVTIIATALVDTNSRMDEVIFQEFKGTGNSELILDRSLAEQYIFPAINVAESGTRREENLRLPWEMRRIALLRRALAEMSSREAIPSLIKRLGKFDTNDEFLKSIPLD